MNSRHPNMKFTSELEENDILPFLDIKVIRLNDMFVTSVYRKPTFSGVYVTVNVHNWSLCTITGQCAE